MKLRIELYHYHYRILRFGPPVPGCYNGEIQSFYAESGPFLDHFWYFSGLLVVILQFIALEYKLFFLARRISVHSIDIHHFKVIVIHTGCFFSLVPPLKV